jgi:hypothetical protein
MSLVQEEEASMGDNNAFMGDDQKKDRFGSANDIARHAVDKSSENVERATDVARGDVAGGIGGIVKNSIDIATHSVDKTREMITGKRRDEPRAESAE